MLPMQRAWVRSLVRELDPACCNEDSMCLKYTSLYKIVFIAVNVNKEAKHRAHSLQDLLVKTFELLGEACVI